MICIQPYFTIYVDYINKAMMKLFNADCTINQNRILFIFAARNDY
jgi:hypothetical protein